VSILKILAMAVVLAMTVSAAAQTDKASSNQNSAYAEDPDVLYGTGMTEQQLRKAGYGDREIAFLRNEAAELRSADAPMSAGAQQGAGTAESQPMDPNREPQRAEGGSGGYWGLLGLLGLIGLAGRRGRRAEVVQYDRGAMDRGRKIA